ncbi:glutathione S-transferase T3-like protein [Tanacetum coccineum]
MRKNHKWKLNIDRDKTRLQEPNKESGGSTKRSRVSEEGDYVVHSNQETPNNGGSTIQRHIGIDDAKKKGNGKASRNNKSVEELCAMRITRGSEIEVDPLYVALVLLITCKLFEKPIRSMTSDEQFKVLFRAYGTIISGNIAKERIGCLGYVDFDKEEFAFNSIHGLNHFEFNGKKLKVMVFGTVYGTSVVIVIDANKKSTCYGFVKFEAYGDALKAIKGSMV